MQKIDEIKNIIEYYKDTLYSGVREQQKKDQSYIDDTFAVPEVKSPHSIIRTGIGNRMVNAPAEHIITSNPQVGFEILSGHKESGERFTEVINRDWLNIMRKMNPNPFKEYVKNLLGRGEAFIRLVHNESWVTGDLNKYGLPVLFLIPDSMVIYANPQEDENGIPKDVVVYYQRQPWEVIQRYNKWSDPNKRQKGQLVEWYEYHDADTYYCEADGEEVRYADNIYGFTPFIRKYSGFGRQSPEGKLEDLIVGDLRYERDLIHEECAIRSDISSVFHLFAHKPITIFVTEDVEAAKIRQEFSLGAYDMNIIKLPEGSKIPEGLQDVMLPTAEAFQHLRDIRNEINQRNPLLLAGFAQGSSGRQQDMSAMDAMRRYDTIIENTEVAFSTAFEKAIEMCGKIPGLKPEGIQSEDYKSEFRCELNLKAADPLEDDRQATLGDRLWARGNGAIDLKTLHTDYLGYSADKSQDIIANILVDKLTLYNPDVARVMGMMFAEESRMEKYIEAAKERAMQFGEQQEALAKEPPPTTQERISGETKTPLGREMVDTFMQSTGARKPPERYTRG